MVLPDAAGWPFEGGVTLPANVEMGQMWHIQTGSAKLASKIFASEVASKCPGPICSAGYAACTAQQRDIGLNPPTAPVMWVHCDLTLMCMAGKAEACTFDSQAVAVAT
ncbi:TPA: hypothetical protein ACH3X2_002412 [Trebouxia sp. C0005]